MTGLSLIEINEVWCNFSAVCLVYKSCSLRSDTYSMLHTVPHLLRYINVHMHVIVNDPESRKMRLMRAPLYNQISSYVFIRVICIDWLTFVTRYIKVYQGMSQLCNMWHIISSQICNICCILKCHKLNVTCFSSMNDFLLQIGRTPLYNIGVT